MTIRIDINSNVNAVLGELESKKEQILEAIGMFVTSEAKARSPVDQGDLRETIHYDVDMSNSKVEIIAGGTGTYKEVDYAAYVEMGTSKMQAQPFMRPAITDNVPRIRQLAKNIMENG